MCAPLFTVISQYDIKSQIRWPFFDDHLCQCRRQGYCFILNNYVLCLTRYKGLYDIDEFKKEDCIVEEVYAVPKEHQVILDVEKTSFAIDFTPSEFNRSDKPGWGVRVYLNAEAKTQDKIMKAWFSDDKKLTSWYSGKKSCGYSHDVSEKEKIVELEVLVNVKHNDTFTNVHKTSWGVFMTVIAPVSTTNYLRKNGELMSHLVH